MNPKVNKDAIRIHNPWLIKERDSSEGAIINVSFIATKDNKPLSEVEFVIFVNGQEPQIVEKTTLTTNQYGFGSTSFVSKANEVRVTILITDKDTGAIFHKDAPKLILVEKKEKPLSESFYKELTPEDGANSILTLGEMDEKTADSDKAFDLILEWLNKKSLYEKTWFVLAFNKAKQKDKETTMNFLEQFIFYHYKNAGGVEKDQLAKNFGLLPPVDVFKKFNELMDELEKKNKKVYENIIELLASVDGDKVKNFQFHSSFMNEEEFITVMNNIAASNSPKKAAEIRGFFNKQKTR